MVSISDVAGARSAEREVGPGDEGDMEGRGRGPRAGPAARATSRATTSPPSPRPRGRRRGRRRRWHRCRGRPRRIAAARDPDPAARSAPAMPSTSVQSRDPAAVGAGTSVLAARPAGRVGGPSTPLEGRALAGHRHRQARPRASRARTNPGSSSAGALDGLVGPVVEPQRGVGGAVQDRGEGVRHRRAEECGAHVGHPALLGEAAVGVVLVGGDGEAGLAVDLALHEVHPRTRCRLERGARASGLTAPMGVGVNPRLR